jgi:hypothetical protein
LQKRDAGGLGGLDTLAGRAFFEIFKIGGGTQETVPMIVSLGRALLQGSPLFRGAFRGGNGGTGRRRRFGRFRRVRWYDRFLHAVKSARNNFKPSR